MTDFSTGGGCACKLPPGELTDVLAGLRAAPVGPEVLVGLGSGDDAAVVLNPDGSATVSTTDFFSPVVDDPWWWGRIAAANAMSDVWAMGGTPFMALNIVAWPRALLPLELLRRVLEGGLAATQEAGCPLLGGHSIDGPEPLYGLAVTGRVDPARMLRNDAARAGLPLTLTKPLGIGVLNTRHKRTGEVFDEALATMATLNRDASAAAVAAGATAATDVTGFGLLGHLHQMMRASQVTAVVDVDAVPLLAGARQAAEEGFVSGGTMRNLDWVRSHLAGSASDVDRLLLADAQTSGGLLVVGEVPGYPVVGEVVAAEPGVTVRLR